MTEGQAVTYTAKQKAAIRGYYSYMPLKFKKDGSVWGKKGQSWGLLYSANDAARHLATVGLSK